MQSMMSWICAQDYSVNMHLQLRWVRALMADDNSILLWPITHVDWEGDISVRRLDKWKQKVCSQSCTAFPSPPVSVSWKPGRASHASVNAMSAVRTVDR